MTCAVCGRDRPFVPTSPLTTHAACSAPAELQDDLLVVRERFAPWLSDSKMAADLGVGRHILRAWLKAALRRRAERRG